MCSGRLAPVCLAGLVWFSGGALYAQSVIRQGGEFQVNQYVLNQQLDPAVAVDADGDFVVSWTDGGQEGGTATTGIFAARFNSAGAILATEFHVNTYTQSHQELSQVAVENNGDFVVVWQSYRQANSGYGYSIFGQRFDSSGTRLGSEFQVNSYTLGYAFRPRIASDNDGDFVVVWQVNGGQDGAAGGIFGRRFNSSGAALATEFIVNSYTTSSQRYPAVALDSDGDFVVVWDSFNNHDGEAYGVFAQRFSSAGARQAIEFQVNTYTSNSQSMAVVGAASNGDFVVAWQSLDQDAPNPTGNLGIFAQRFSSAGARQGVEFQVNVFFTNYQRLPEIAVNNSGGFVVTWESRFQDGSYESVFARRFAPGGGAIGGEFQVNSYTFDGQLHQAVDWDSDGDFVVAWYSEPAQDGNAYGVFAQRFSLPPLATLDVDGNGVLSALTDGLLILRKFFGFTGDTLISGVVGNGCTRCDATSISNYITGLGLILDIDNNGELNALTDGLLCVRFLFGFSGTTLTSGDVAGNCSGRCDAATILPYLQTLD